MFIDGEKGKKLKKRENVKMFTITGDKRSEIIKFHQTAMDSNCDNWFRDALCEIEVEAHAKRKDSEMIRHPF